MNLKPGRIGALALFIVGSIAFGGAAQNSERVLVALENGGAVLLCARTGGVLQRFNTGPNAFGALFSPNGKRAFVTDKDQGTLSEIDLQSGKVIESISVGVQPQQPAMTSAGKIYIPLSGGAAIAMVDASQSLRLVGQLGIGQGTKPHIVSLSPDEKTLWATVQGHDPKVVAFSLTVEGEKLAREYRYNLFPRVISAGNGFAYFTGHHSTGLHKADLASETATTPYMDVNGNFSEAAKQIEGVSFMNGKVLGITHEGRKALVTLNSSSPSCDIAPLSDKPYWVSLDSTGEIAFVSIPGKALVEAYDVKSCNKRPLWSRDVGGKAKRMALSEAN